MTAAARLDPDQMNSDAIILRDLNADPDILVPGKQNCIANRLLTRELYKIRNNEGIDAFLFACTIHETKPNLHVI